MLKEKERKTSTIMRVSVDMGVRGQAGFQCSRRNTPQVVSNTVIKEVQDTTGTDSDALSQTNEWGKSQE